MVRLKFLLVSKTRSSDRNRSNITQEYGEPAMACAPRSEINRIGRNSGNQPALEDPGGGGFLRCRTGCTARKRLRVEDHVLPDRNKTCPRILHSPRSLRQVDCSPGLSSPPGRSRPQKTLRHVTNELKVALAGHAAIWARHSPQNPRQRLGPPADIRRSTRIIVSYPSWPIPPRDREIRPAVLIESAREARPRPTGGVSSRDEGPTGSRSDGFGGGCGVAPNLRVSEGNVGPTHGRDLLS
jgi:hypothetical protein